MTRQQLAKPVFGALTAATETAIDDQQTAALIGAASYRHDSRQAALRAQYEAAATGIRAERSSGRLGFTKAIVLLEDGCEEFSNIEGLGQMRFPKGNIKSKFEDIRLVLAREGLTRCPKSGAIFAVLFMTLWFSCTVASASDGPALCQVNRFLHKWRTALLH
jgi:hypothetical protein